MTWNALLIEDIKQLQARRVRSLDTEDWELDRACHAPDMEHELDGVKVAGLDAVMTRVSREVEGAVSIHHVHSPENEVTSATTATGIWALEDHLIWPSKWQHGYGHYFDTYKKLNGTWVFTSRTITRLRMETVAISND